jgi:DNA polymerase
VEGRGIKPADIFIMGEAPGKKEDLNGEAFIGAAGQLLDKMLADAVNLIEREQSVKINLPTIFITNTVLCRPTNYLLGPNRQPEPIEILACRDNIFDIYERVDPKLVILIGKIARDFYGKIYKEHIHILHPAALLRKGSQRSHLYKPNVRKLAEAIRWLEN